VLRIATKGERHSVFLPVSPYLALLRRGFFSVATRHAVGARLGPLSFAMPQWQNWIMARPTRLFGDWRPIDTAPLNEDVTLLVTDGRGDPYLIPYPCRRIAASGWVNSSKGNLLAVTPLQWKPYSPPRR
jgi:hypothetical protein